MGKQSSENENTNLVQSGTLPSVKINVSKTSHDITNVEITKDDIATKSFLPKIAEKERSSLKGRTERFSS